MVRVHNIPDRLVVNKAVAVSIKNFVPLIMQS